MEWTPTPEQETAAKMIASGALGSMMAIYLRHPGSALRALCMLVMGVGMASIFGDTAAEWTGLPIAPASFLVGLLGHKLAERALKAADRADLGGFTKKRD
jgi:hypothetical protein